MMPASDEQRFLGLFRSNRRAGAGLVVILAEVAGRCAVIDSLKVNAVLRRDLVFELKRNGELIEVVVGPEAVERVIKDIRSISHVVVDAVLRGGLGPVAATLVFGAGDKAD